MHAEELVVSEAVVYEGQAAVASLSSEEASGSLL
jgi:hypothetical protein